MLVYRSVAPEKWWLEDYILSFWKDNSFRGFFLNFRGVLEVVDPFILGLLLHERNECLPKMQHSNHIVFVWFFQVDKIIDIRKQQTALFDRNIHQHVVCFRISAFGLSCLWNLDWISKKELPKWYKCIGNPRKLNQHAPRNRIPQKRFLWSELKAIGEFGDITPSKNQWSISEYHISPLSTPWFFTHLMYGCNSWNSSSNHLL